MSDDQTGEPVTESKISKLFDIRLVVGSLLVLYGLILFVKGFFDTPAQIHKGAGLHLNTWTGVGMLVVGALMLLWLRLRPLAPFVPDETAEDEGPQASRAE